MSSSICGKLDGEHSSKTPSEPEELGWKRRKREDLEDDEQRCTDHYTHLEGNQDNPMQYLPVEVVSHIFTFCLPDPPSNDMTHEGHYHNAVPLQLGAVCQYWRRIAWSTPQLWNILWLEVTTSATRTMVRSQLLPEWLARSGKLPLFISMTALGRWNENSVVWDSTTRMVDTLRLYAKRWRVLKVLLPAFHLFRLSQSDYSTLETLVVKSLSAFYADLTGGIEEGIEFAKNSPRYVSMKTGFNTCWDISSLDWKNISHLALDGFYHHRVLEILDQASNVEDLTLTYVLDHVNTPSKIILHSLQKLHVNHTSLATFSSEHFSCPNLELLSWDKAKSSPVDLADIMTRWACPLTDLTFSTDGTPDELFHLFNATPLLTRLSLQGECMTEEFFEGLHEPNTTTTSYLPRLRELHLLCTVHSDFQWSSVALLAPPMDHDLCNGICRPLSKIHIQVRPWHKGENIIICKDEIILMLKMIDRGIELKIEDISCGWDLPFNLLPVVDTERGLS